MIYILDPGLGCEPVRFTDEKAAIAALKVCDSGASIFRRSPRGIWSKAYWYANRISWFSVIPGSVPVKIAELVPSPTST